MSERRNLIAFVGGMKGSGKSQLLNDYFAVHQPRILSIDITGETIERNANAIPAFGLAQLLEVLEVAAEWERWHVAACLPPDAIPELFALLAPRLESEDTLGFSRAVGGMAIECGESYSFAPNKGTAREVEDAICIGRHHQLSFLLGTQRPASCSRLLSSQADYMIALAQTEPLDIAWWGKAISKAAAAEIGELQLYHFVFFRRGDPHFFVCGPDRKPYRQLKLNGHLLYDRRASPRVTAPRAKSSA